MNYEKHTRGIAVSIPVYNALPRWQIDHGKDQLGYERGSSCLDSNNEESQKEMSDQD